MKLPAARITYEQREGHEAQFIQLAICCGICSDVMRKESGTAFVMMYSRIPDAAPLFYSSYS
jgi:hypothetical protein